jgi:hypothetical protein
VDLLGAILLVVVVMGIFILSAYRVGQEAATKHHKMVLERSQYFIEGPDKNFHMVEYTVDQVDSDISRKEDSTEVTTVIWLKNSKNKYNRSHFYWNASDHSFNPGDKVYLGYPVGKGITTG